MNQSSRVKEVKHHKKNKRHRQAPGDPGIQMTGKYRHKTNGGRQSARKKRLHERHQVRSKPITTHVCAGSLNGPCGCFFSDVGRFSSPRDERAGGASTVPSGRIGPSS